MSHLMALGGYRFTLETAAYQTLTRRSSYQWPTQARIRNTAAAQFTGFGAETVTIPGVIYPHFAGGLGQVDAMRAQAQRGEPLLMVSGTGENLGWWSIVDVEDTQEHLLKDGQARKIAFRLTLQRYSAEED